MADATWHGSMVGTIQKCLAQDHILRGDAELTFDMSDSTLDAFFFNIRDYARFGEEYNVRGMHGEKKTRSSSQAFGW